VIFSLSAGLSEALLSPTIAAIPSDNPQRDMSMLHSLYAFGVLTMVVIGTLFLRLFGSGSWVWLMLMLALFPVIPAILFALSPIPDMGGHAAAGGSERTRRRTVGMALCVACIFFGSCAENAMSNWISGFMENALQIDKTLGDILGVAVFAVLLGLMRIGYARFGRRITPVLAVGMIGAALCYLAAGLCPGVAIPFTACILTGLFTAMLWPGALIFMEDNVPAAGVTAYALMAAGGDMGASLAPQLLGIVVDSVSATPLATELGLRLGITAEQVGLKAGMLVTAVFPLLGAVILLFTVRFFKRTSE
jgi:MFS family permease